MICRKEFTRTNTEETQLSLNGVHSLTTVCSKMDVIPKHKVNQIKLTPLNSTFRKQRVTHTYKEPNQHSLSAEKQTKTLSIPIKYRLTNLLTLTDFNIYHGEECKQVDVIYTDFLKAFDKIKYYLLNRNNVVAVSNCLSGRFESQFGSHLG